MPVIQPCIFHGIQEGELRVFTIDGVFFIGNDKGENVCVDLSDDKSVRVVFLTQAEAQHLIDKRKVAS